MLTSLLLTLQVCGVGGKLANFWFPGCEDSGTAAGIGRPLSIPRLPGQMVLQSAPLHAAAQKTCCLIFAYTFPAFVQVCCHENLVT